MVPCGNIEGSLASGYDLGLEKLVGAACVFIGLLRFAFFSCRYSVGLVPLGGSRTEGLLNGTGLVNQGLRLIGVFCEVVVFHAFSFLSKTQTKDKEPPKKNKKKTI